MAKIRLMKVLPTLFIVNVGESQLIRTVSVGRVFEVIVSRLIASLRHITHLFLPLHHVHNVSLLHSVHVNGYNSSRGGIFEENPLNFLVCQIFAAFPHDLSVPVVRIIGLRSVNIGGTLGVVPLGTRGKIPKDRLLVTVDNRVRDVDLGAPIEKTVFRPQVVVQILYQPVAMELHV